MALAHLACLVLGGDDDWVRRVTDVSFVVFPAFATYGMLAGRREAVGAARRTWSLSAVSMCMWTTGGVVWCCYTFTTGTVTYPSLADFLWIFCCLPALVALLQLPCAERRGGVDVRVALDTTVIALSLLLVWQRVLAPEGTALPALSAAEVFVTYGRSIADLLLLSVLAATVMRARRSELGPWLALLGGMSLLAVFDMTYVRLAAAGDYDTSSPINVAWSVVFLLIGAAPRLGCRLGTGGARASTAQALVPYAALFAGGASVLPVKVLAADQPVLAACVLVLLLLAGVSHLLVVVDRVSLASHLEGKVTESARQLGDEREFLHAVVDQLHAGVTAYDVEHRLIFHNRAAAHLHADPTLARGDAWPEDLRRVDGRHAVGPSESPLARALAGEDVRDQPLTVVPPGAVPAVVSVSSRPLRTPDGTVFGAVLAMHDVTEQRQQQRELERKVLLDPLTGLGNRDAFKQCLTELLQAGTSVAVLLLDLDDFKHVNDSLGHPAGDQCLVQIARRLQAGLPEGSVSCRLGGDEFVLLVPGCSVAAAEALAVALLAVVGQILTIGGTELKPSASIGIALSGPGYLTPSELLKAADLAMYLSKERGKGQFAFYEERLRQTAIDRMGMESDLRSAVASGSLHLRYQPIVELDSGRMTAVEALVRWQHPVRGAVSPLEFIPIAEDTGLVLPLGAWVLREACAQLLAWDRDVEDPDVRLTLNISTRQLERPGLLDVLDECLADGVDPRRLCLEVTETALSYDSEAALRTLHAIRERGVHLAVDDFGTGYSSLSRLRSAPISQIKIDRSFIKEIDRRHAHVPIVEATMAMSRGLGLGVVAVGVETPEQLAYLYDTGCPEGQGNLLSLPVDAATIGELLRTALPWEHITRDRAGAGQVQSRCDLETLVRLASTPEVGLEAFGRLLLEALLSATRMESAYLSRVTGERQQVVLTHPGPHPWLAKDTSCTWRGSAQQFVLDSPDRRAGDLRSQFLHAQVNASRVPRRLLAEPVLRSDGEMYGVLCVESDRAGGVHEPDSAMVRIFARLLEQKLFGGPVRHGEGPRELTSDQTRGPTTPAGGDPHGVRAQREQALTRWHEYRTGQRPPAGGAERLRDGLTCPDFDVQVAEQARVKHVAEQRSRPSLDEADAARVVIADDVLLLRQLLGMHVHHIRGLVLAGEADSAASTVGVVVAEQPDLLVLDFELGDATADAIVPALRAFSPRTRILLHSGRDDLRALGQRMNVDRVVHKGDDPEQLAEALRALAPQQPVEISGADAGLRTPR